MKPSACSQTVHYQLRAQPLQSEATKQDWHVTAGLPSALTVKGESPGLLAENWPPREVIRKHRLKKPIPTTKILQERDGDKVVFNLHGSMTRLELMRQTERKSTRDRQGKMMKQAMCARKFTSRGTWRSPLWGFMHCGHIFQSSHCNRKPLCTRLTVSSQMNHYMDGFSASHCAQWADIQNKKH